MRIGLCGTMSVGKTTLVNALKELDQFKDYEFDRDVIDFSITTLIKRYGHRINNIEVIKGSTEERIKQILKFIES
jgi:GTPase SAR1 family protein